MQVYDRWPASRGDTKAFCPLTVVSLFLFTSFLNVLKFHCKQFGLDTFLCSVVYRSFIHKAPCFVFFGSLSITNLETGHEVNVTFYLLEISVCYFIWVPLLTLWYDFCSDFQHLEDSIGS